MAPYRRKDSPVWWLWLETTGARERTEIRVGATPKQIKDSRALADQVYHARMLDLARGHYGLRRADRVTFAAYSAWWTAHVAAHHRSVERETEIVARLSPTFGASFLDEITKELTMEWMTARLATASAGTVNRELDVLKQILNSAVPTYLEVSPLFRLKRLRCEGVEVKTLSRADERKLLRVLPPADTAIMLLGLDCLLRLSDVINLRREHDHGTYLSIVDPKTEPYKVPVSVRVRKALDRLPVDGPYYFAARRQAARSRDFRSSVKQMLWRACTRAGVAYGRGRGITFHGLRHTGATRMVLAGVPLRIVQAVGGWKSLRQLERYAHPTDAANRAAVETVGGRKRFA